MICRETDDPKNQLKARMLTTFTEDLATGSANGCLAGYLVKHRYLGSDEVDIRVLRWEDRRYDTSRLSGLSQVLR